MGDLDVIRQFRADVPQPDEETIRAARARVIEHIDGSATPRRSKPVVNRRRWMIPVGIAAAALVLALALPALLPSGVPSGPGPAAAAVLQRFARIARNAPPEPAPKPGQYLYTETTSATTYVFVPGEPYEPFWWTESGTEQRWLGTDGSGRSLYEVGQPTFLTDRDRAAYEAYVAAGGPEAQSWEFDWGRTFDDRYAAGELAYADLSGMPTDPDWLLEATKERGYLDPEADAWRIFEGTGGLLAVYYAPPEVRAALYELMAGLPGIELLGDVRDELGRRGIGIGLVNSGMRQELIFDRQTAKLLAERLVVVEPIDVSDTLSSAGPSQIAAASDPGQVMSSRVYLTYGEVVDSTEETPTG